MSTRRATAVAAIVLALGLPSSLAGKTTVPAARLAATDFRASNGGAPYAGDDALLTTISPNDDGLRDRATVSFRLSRPASVRFVVARTRPGRRIVYARTERRQAGRSTFVWAPPRWIRPRTYVVWLTLRDGAERRVYRPLHASDPSVSPVIRVQGVDVAFTRASSPPASPAVLRIATDARALTLQFFRARAKRHGRLAADEMSGTPVSDRLTLDWTRWRNAPRQMRVWIGDWPSGVYFAKLVSPDGGVGYAPIIVRPRQLGAHRIAVVMPTNTWQAYNFYDGDGDGFGDTWYAGWKQRIVRLGRPYTERGVPPFFRYYDLPFITWLASRGEDADFLAEDDLERAPEGRLPRDYDLIVFPGHTEYVTEREYDVVERFRDRGGNVIFLSANNFYWRVLRRGARLVKTARWRDLGRPEAGLIGVQYRGNDGGERRAPFVVRQTAGTPWLFEGTGLRVGSRFGSFGIEIDGTTSSSPPGTRVLAEVPHLLGPGVSAQMTYYETPAGAKVFAAGAFTLAGSALFEPEGRLVGNLWRYLSEP